MSYKTILNEGEKELKKEIIADPEGVLTALVFGDNKKIGEIPSLNCETALNCSSEALGFCEICEYCYAKSDARQYKGHGERMERGSLLFGLLKKSIIIFKLFVEYLEQIEPLAVRFNIVGDFSTPSDIGLIYNLALELPNIRFYGYTKRQDLKAELERFCSLENVFLGVPDSLEVNGANWFEVTPNIEDWFLTGLKCLGDCGRCKKCFSLKDSHIACLLHGSPSKIQKAINTPQNWEFMGLIFEQYLGVSLPSEHKGFFCRSLNKFLESEGFEVPYTLTKKGNKSYTLNTVPKLINWAKSKGAL